MAKAVLFLVFGFYSIFIMDAACGQTSILDTFVKPLRIARRNFEKSIEEELMSLHNQNLLRSQDKLQPYFLKPFPCSLNNTRSKTRPKSVHMLRPGDIDVIGALGDSLTAGFGVFATSIWQLVYESRGASFFSGGDASWRLYLTIANILKVFNPKLYGYSTNNTFSVNPLSGFNVAEGGAISDNLPYMVRVLVARIKSDPQVKLEKDWKFINIAMGANDFSSEICYSKSPEKLLLKHQNELLYTLRYLRDNLPKTLVNLIPAFNPINLKKPGKPEVCIVMAKALSPCLFGVIPDIVLDSYLKILLRWQELDGKIGNLKEFQRDGFAVVLQPFTINMTTPMKGGNLDISYLSADCFHFSQKGYAAIANIVWNSMMTPVGKKPGVVNYNILEQFLCPTKDNPYIFTNRNSRINKN